MTTSPGAGELSPSSFRSVPPKREIPFERHPLQTGLSSALDQDPATERGGGSGERARRTVVLRDAALDRQVLEDRVGAAQNVKHPIDFVTVDDARSGSLSLDRHRMAAVSYIEVSLRRIVLVPVGVLDGQRIGPLRQRDQTVLAAGVRRLDCMAKTGRRPIDGRIGRGIETAGRRARSARVQQQEENHQRCGLKNPL